MGLQVERIGACLRQMLLVQPSDNVFHLFTRLRRRNIDALTKDFIADESSPVHLSAWRRTIVLLFEVSHHLPAIAPPQTCMHGGLFDFWKIESRLLFATKKKGGYRSSVFHISNHSKQRGAIVGGCLL